MKLLTKFKKVKLFIMLQSKKIVETVFSQYLYDDKNLITKVILLYFFNISTINKLLYFF